MNKIMLVGTLGADAEVKTMKSGHVIVSFSVADSTNGFKTKDGKEIPSKTNWFRCIRWNSEKLADYLKKGTEVSIIGEIEQSTNDGKTYMVINVEDIKIHSRKNKDESNNNPSPKVDSPSPKTEDDEDLPF